MPLIHSGSKKAFSKNVEIEMKHGKPQDQALAISYSIKRKAKKKMATGGSVSASDEKRPMPNAVHDDAAMVSRNSSRKDNAQSGWTDTPTERQAISNNGRMVKPIKHPRMVASNVVQTRLRDEEDHMQSSMSPGPYDAQPPQHDDEEGADRQGTKVPDMQREHNNGRKPYALGGAVEGEEHSPHSRQMRDARSNEDHIMEINPAHDIHSPDDSEDQPRHEADMEHEDSLVAAIMARNTRPRSGADSDSDIDHEMMMAHGGEINSHDDADDIHSASSIDSTHSSQADLSRNADEDANEEDQLSYNALRKENYSETPGLDALDSPMDSNRHGDEREIGSHDSHDMVESIRRKMANRQFKQR